MSKAKLFEAVKKAGEGLLGGQLLEWTLTDFSKKFEAPPPSTIRRIAREWGPDGTELESGYRVSIRKIGAKLFITVRRAGVRPESQSPRTFHNLG